MNPVDDMLTATRGDFRGWEACILRNRFVRLVAVPAIGGRVMAYDLGTHDFLFVDPDLAGKLFTPEENQGDGSLAAWKNYGGDKTWPAPQGWDTADQWHGPPDPVLDSGRYTLDELGSDGAEAVVAMTSPPDARTGIQICRRLTLSRGSSRVRLELSFRNVVDWPVRWSIWDVTQLRADRTLPDGARAHDPTCVVTAPLNPASRFRRGFQVMFGAEDNPQWQVEGGLFTAPYLWQIGKVGIDSPAGWIAFSHGSQGVAFTERFTFEPDGAYPDGGATVECWTVGAGQVANLDYADSGIFLMETEVLSPLYTILPGEEATFALEWGSCRCPGTVVDVSEAGCVTQPLSARLADGAVHLSGQFGVFDEGLLDIVWLDARNRRLHRESVARVNPLAAVHVDSTLPSPAGAEHVELRVTAGDGLERRLAAAVLKEATA